MAGSYNTESNKTFNHPKEVSTQSTPDTSKANMVLEHSTSKKAIKYSSVLDVLIMEEEGNVTPTAEVKKRSPRNRTVGRE